MQNYVTELNTVIIHSLLSNFLSNMIHDCKQGSQIFGGVSAGHKVYNSCCPDEEFSVEVYEVYSY